LLRGFLNSWALYGLSLSDAVFFDDMPAMRFDQYPIVRRFYSQEPARNTRYVTELFKTIEEANEARRTMRFMDRTYRTGFADDLEFSEGNRQYGQATFAEKQMRAMRQEIARVTWAKELDDVQRIANEYGRERAMRQFIADLKASPVWTDEGRLKRALIEHWVTERNAFAEEMVKDMRQPAEAAR